jgi:hypothetical protein
MKPWGWKADSADASLQRGDRQQPLAGVGDLPSRPHPSLNVRAVIDYFIDVFGTPLYWQR